MSITSTAHINFDGRAKEALEYWARVFDGEVVLMPYGDAAETPEQREQIVWGQVTAPSGIHLMAYDVQASLPYEPGVNSMYMSLQSPDRDEIQRVWDALVDGSEVAVPIGPSAFSPHYGKLTDRYGVTWIISVVAGW